MKKYDAIGQKGNAVTPSDVWLYSGADSKHPNTSYFPDEENNHGVKGGIVAKVDGSVEWVARKDYVQKHELSQDNNRTREYPSQ